MEPKKVTIHFSSGTTRKDWSDRLCDIIQSMLLDPRRTGPVTIVKIEDGWTH